MKFKFLLFPVILVGLVSCASMPPRVAQTDLPALTQPQQEKLRSLEEDVLKSSGDWREAANAFRQLQTTYRLELEKYGRAGRPASVDTLKKQAEEMKQKERLAYAILAESIAKLELAKAEIAYAGQTGTIQKYVSYLNRVNSDLEYIRKHMPTYNDTDQRRQQ